MCMMVSYDKYQHRFKDSEGENLRFSQMIDSQSQMHAFFFFSGEEPQIAQCG